MATLKPPTPLLAPNKGPLKPASPLRPKTAPKKPISHPQRRWRFQPTTGTSEQRRQGFHPPQAQARKGNSGFRQPAQLAYRVCLRYPWAEAGPGRATGGRPTLQTSSNQSSLNLLASAHVTNVVNLRPKTLIFSEKDVGLTTFVTTDQKSTRKTPPIDDVCNNTQRSAPRSQHDKPDHIGGVRRTRLQRPWAAAGPGRASSRRAKPHASTPGPTGVKGPGGIGGPGCGARGRRRGQGGPRDRSLRAAGSRVAISRAGRRPRAHQAARPKHGKQRSARNTRGV